MQKVLQELPTIKKYREIWPKAWPSRTCIMGVLNITPDSFSDGGLYLSPDLALKRAIELVNLGADILDIGAQSTRPGAIDVGAEIELKRLIPVIKLIRDKIPNIIISIDTFLAPVAEELLNIGADWVNDISGGRRDPEILNVVAKYQCPYVITHSRGNSRTMDKLTQYINVVEDVNIELKKLTEIAIRRGIKPDKIIWDPGLGFAKTTKQNIALIRNLELLINSGFPLLVGPSRKRFIGELTHESNVENRVWGTAAVVCRCVQAKVNIVRIHDIEAISKTILMAQSIWN